MGVRDGRNNLYCLVPSTQGRSPWNSTHSINLTSSLSRLTFPTPISTTAELWHKRVGHLNYQSLTQLSKQHFITGMPTLPLLQQHCGSCILGKQHRQPIPKVSTTSTNRILQLVHSDLCGPLPIPSLTESNYILIFIDDYSRYSWLYFLKTKDETLEAFKHFKRLVENQAQQKLACLRIDRGGEYVSHAFNSFCATEGVQRQFIAAGTPQQNGIAERKNRHLLETVRMLLFDAKLPSYLWEEAARTANYLTNRMPTIALLKTTPFGRYFRQKPDFSHLRTFGCAAFLHVQKCSKLEPKSLQTVFLGYDKATKAYRCYDYNRRKILISRDVVFHEQQLGLPAQIFKQIFPFQIPISSEPFLT
jgi:hypothetical protein